MDHPSTCAAAPNIKPIPLGIKAGSDVEACAVTPANSAAPLSVAKDCLIFATLWRTTRSANWTPTGFFKAVFKVAESGRIGPNARSTRSGKLRVNGPKSRRHAPPYVDRKRVV